MFCSQEVRLKVACSSTKTSLTKKFCFKYNGSILNIMLRIYSKSKILFSVSGVWLI